MTTINDLTKILQDRMDLCNAESMRQASNAAAISRAIDALRSAPQTTPEPDTPPEGFILYGEGPLKVLATSKQLDDVAMFFDERWASGAYLGDSSSHIYALRAGSEIAHLNGLFLPGEAPNETKPSGQPFIPGGWPEEKIPPLPECPEGHAWRFVPVEEINDRMVKDGSVSYYAAPVRGVWRRNYAMTHGCGIMYIESVPKA